MIRTLLLIIIAIPSFSQGKVQILVDEVNAFRIKHHRIPLEYRPDNQAQCDRWAISISKSLNHNYIDKRKGEVIGSFITIESVVHLFMESETHKKILLDKKARFICLSVYETEAKTIVKKNSVEEIPTLFHTVIRTY